MARRTPEFTGCAREGESGERFYFIGIGGNADETAQDPNDGEWRLMIERHRRLLDKITGRNKATADEPMFGVIEEILRAEPDFRNVRRE